MTYSVYQHWDPLTSCVVGRCYDPTFFSFVKNQKTRQILEKLAEETEEDCQELIKLLEKFNVNVLRPEIPDVKSLFIDNKWIPPPIAPRDYFIMMGKQLFVPQIPNRSHAWNSFYMKIKESTWPNFQNQKQMIESNFSYCESTLKKFQAFSIIDQQKHDIKLSFYQSIFDHIKSTETEIVYTDLDYISGCYVSRIGRDLFFATQDYHDDQKKILNEVNQLFTTTRNHVVNSGGHGDATYCPLGKGLIVSLKDIPTYADTFPNWEVVYLQPSQYEHSENFIRVLKQNYGKWWLPGFETDNGLCQLIENYFDNWVGNAAETVFEVNILLVDPFNMIVSSHNSQVENACKRYNINMHISPFRHRYFWDAGIHCITNDLNRLGDMGTFLW